ncbi:MAG: cytochrome c peroxidase [Pirellulaceae bacterium]
MDLATWTLWVSRSLLLTCVIAFTWGCVVAAEECVRPVDVCFFDNDRLLLVACQQSGEVLALDAVNGEVRSRLPLGGRLVGVQRLPNGRAWAIDQSGNRLIEVGIADGNITILNTVANVISPVEVAAGKRGELLVSGLWSRKVYCITEPMDGGNSKLVWACDLEFNPHTVRLLEPENIVLAVDAFGSQIAYLDASTGKHLRQMEFFGHRLRGMVDDPDGQRLIVSHQMLNSAAQSSTNDIHWGMMVSNDLRWLDRTRILAADEATFYKDGHIDPIGTVGNGGADPMDLVCTKDGIVIVPLGGVNEVAIGHEEFFELDRLPVGINPVAVDVRGDGRVAWVVNRLDDSLTQIDVVQRKVMQTVELSKDRQLSSVDLGERLFHDASISHDGWMSCASCHPGGHAVNEMADNLSDGSYNSPKRVLSLLGRSKTAPFGWVGSDATLAGQLRRSVRTTMQGLAPLRDEQVVHLTAFLDSLSSPPSVLDLQDPSVAEAIQRGDAIFRRESCNDCHAGREFTSSQLYDVGLKDEVGNERFNPPSLLGVGQRGPRYFHDLRAPSLRAVFVEFKHALDKDLADAELDDLLMFLRSL